MEKGTKHVIGELYKTIEKMGGQSDILSIIGGWQDTLTDDETYNLLKDFNKNTEYCNESTVKKILQILHKDGVIDCNEYQASDFKFLIKRLKKEK